MPEPSLHAVDTEEVDGEEGSGLTSAEAKRYVCTLCVVMMMMTQCACLRVRRDTRCITG